ncbi:glycosyltransferase [Psychrobacter sp. TAE2020]|uniref:glycosyltransferase family 2 protein n=1 Tax=Psychrobacter sp. TAE2020 TaxID=2846762 RepID=UPI001C12978A|nr:glycosyltransferase family 2 protein [Psychrobacter sp. TAE2020]MBU5617763.1 glycosyltransferase [Psychrobacter sp. TAE2020]
MIVNKVDKPQHAWLSVDSDVCHLSVNAAHKYHQSNQAKLIAELKLAESKPAEEITPPIQLSFQLMTCAEPPEMVIASIESLLAIKAADDEILIIDNNNTAVELYKPLADFCNSLHQQLKVRFYHVDTVAGFKAGALNLALQLMDAQSTHVVVVDSDYQALAHSRSAIAAAIHNYPDCALLQFPQFYRDADRLEVDSELNHYFNYHLYRRFNRQRALSTGTYAVIQYPALIQLGGWSGVSITEDAQMGVLMHKQGLRSQFIPEVIATGLLPTTISDLLNQRRRWIYGNAQVLKGYADIASVPALKTAAQRSSKPSLSVLTNTDSDTFTQRLAYRRAHFSQLSAWINATGIFILLQAITLLLLLVAVVTQSRFDTNLVLAPLYLVYASYGIYLTRRLWAYWHDESPLNRQLNPAMASTSASQRLRVWVLHLNFWELGALSWLPVLWGRNKPFICTPKLTIERNLRTLLLENIFALPKLLLVLNLITAFIVSPFSALYSPLLFACALSICLLKIWAAKVMLTNYAYKNPEVKCITKPVSQLIISPIIKSGISTVNDPLADTQQHSALNLISINDEDEQATDCSVIKQPLNAAKTSNNHSVNS